jgi:hypothetical protein
MESHGGQVGPDLIAKITARGSVLLSAPDSVNAEKTRARMQHRNRVIVGVAAIAVVIGVAGCGGSGSASTSSTPTVALNGENLKTPAQILADVRAAAATATSVHVTGTVPQGSSPIVLDLNVANNQTATGSMQISGQPINIIRIGTTVYFKAPAAFYTAQGASAAGAQLLGGRWVKVPASMATSSSYAGFFALTDLHKLTGSLLSPTGAVTNAGEGTVQGTKVVYLADGTKGKLAVSLQGKPYPLQVTPSTGSSGQVTFTWDAPPATVTAPAGAVDLSALGAG